MKENSIEEVIKRLERGMNDIWFSTRYNQEQEEEEEEDLKILLSDYKRVLKENEEQKELIERMKKYLLKENKMSDFLESEE